MGWRGLVWIDQYGHVWEWELEALAPVLVGKITMTVDGNELDLTEADRELLADLKVTV